MASQSGVMSEFCAIGDLTCELVWVKDLLSDLDFTFWKSNYHSYCWKSCISQAHKTHWDKLLCGVPKGGRE